MLHWPCRLQMLPPGPALSTGQALVGVCAVPLTCLVCDLAFVQCVPSPNLETPVERGLQDEYCERRLRNYCWAVNHCRQSSACSSWEPGSQWCPAGSVLKGQCHVQCDELGPGCTHSFFLLIIALLQYSSTHNSPPWRPDSSNAFTELSVHHRSQF